MKNFLTLILICQVFIFPFSVNAQDSPSPLASPNPPSPSASSSLGRTTTLNEGDPAPFSGTLLDSRATARMIAELQFNRATCNLRVSEAVERRAAIMQLSIDQLQIRMDTNNQIFTRRLEIKDSQIQFMDRELNRSTIHPAWWIVGGIVVGAGIALGSFAAAGQFSQ
jgi:hypothetical protein